MKILAKGEEQEYYRAISYYGTGTGLSGLLISLTVTACIRRYYPPFRQLSLPLQSTFVIYPSILAISAGANHGCHSFQSRIHPQTRKYIDQSELLVKETRAAESKVQRVKEWLYEHKFKALGVIWGATMAVSMELMSRDPFTTRARKIVQARILAQATTLTTVLMLALIEAKDIREGKGKWQEVLVVDQNDPEHQHHFERKLHFESYPGQDTWKDMVARNQNEKEGKRRS